MTALELWAVLGGPSGFYRVSVGGDVVWVDVADPDRFVRLVDGGLEVGELEVGAVPFEARSCNRPGRSSVLWVRAEGPSQREAVEHFAPSPTLVLGEGAAHVALWALEQPLSRHWTDRLNLRLAHRLGTKKAHATPWFSFSPAGAILRRGRGRPVMVETVAWTEELHSAKAVAGGLEDAPDPRAAWKARQNAA